MYQSIKIVLAPDRLILTACDANLGQPTANEVDGFSETHENVDPLCLYLHLVACDLEYHLSDARDTPVTGLGPDGTVRCDY